MEGNREGVREWEVNIIKAKKSKEKEKAKAQTTWEQCNGQISALPLPLTLALCSEHMMPQDAHHWIGNNIPRVDKVRGKEQRRANCAGYFRWTVRKHTLLPIASLLEVLHHFVARSVVLGKMGASKTQRETYNTVSRFYHARMILFRMGSSICPGLIDGGLNIIDTLETREIRPVKPLNLPI